jgi:hypothetical protein
MKSAISWPEIHALLAIISKGHTGGLPELKFIDTAACQGQGYALVLLSKGLQADNSAI